MTTTFYPGQRRNKTHIFLSVHLNFHGKHTISIFLYGYNDWPFNSKNMAIFRIIRFKASYREESIRDKSLRDDPSRHDSSRHDSILNDLIRVETILFETSRF